MNSNSRRTPWLGLHDRLETPRLSEALNTLGLTPLARWQKDLHADELSPLLTSHLARELTQLLLSLRESEASEWQPRLEELRAALAASDHPFNALVDELPRPPFRRLLEVLPPEAVTVGQGQSERPDTPLGISALLTGSSRTPSLISQIRAELLSADRADWLVSFIKWSGIRPLKEALQRFTQTPAPDGGPRLHVATTSYLGATDLKAVEFLTSLPHTEVRASFDTHRTRLHAKAYTFHRQTGFGSSYVGSANVSKVALDEGLEWTAKISQHELPQLWRQITAAFESHWDDPAEFEPIHRNDLFRLKAALDAEKGASSGNPAPASTFFELRPYAFQQEILDAIARERAAGLHRHLVIAATGTGKTMVAAFDYQR
ncbi:MAG: DEAD/DEAH box helicase family protein, partial [Halomonas sp.]|nr:DEAD/DEAH box helicase family protein [Halomonas sp.]